MKKFLNKKVNVNPKTLNTLAKIGYGIAIASLCVSVTMAVIDKVGDK